MTPLQTTLENEPVWAVPMAAGERRGASDMLHLFMAATIFSPCIPEVGFALKAQVLSNRDTRILILSDVIVYGHACIHIHMCHRHSALQ